MVKPNTLRILVSIFCLFSITTFAQKKFKNDRSYRFDPLIYYFQNQELTNETRIHKQLLKSSISDSLSLNKLNQLAESKRLIKIQHLFLIKYPAKKSQHILFETPSDSILGPYKTQYGQYKFFKITQTSKERSSKWGDCKFYNFEILDKTKGPEKKLLNVAKKFSKLFSTGKGNEKAIFKQIDKFKGEKAKLTDYLGMKKTDQMLKDAPSGNSGFYVDYPKYIVLINLAKAEKGKDYVFYEEYIFK